MIWAMDHILLQNPRIYSSNKLLPVVDFEQLFCKLNCTQTDDEETTVLCI